jgi:hypothetical protein
MSTSLEEIEHEIRFVAGRPLRITQWSDGIVMWGYDVYDIASDQHLTDRGPFACEPADADLAELLVAAGLVQAAA